MNKQRAFTLFECLWALFLIVLTLLGMNQLLFGMRKIDNYLHFQQTQDFQLSMIQLEHQLKDFQWVKIEPQKVVLESKVAENGYYPKAILKLSAVNNFMLSINSGNQPILKQVKSIHFQENNQFIQIDVYFKEGNEKHATLLLPPKTT
ncbi:ComGF family competence protein [Enterococcus cecorum]